MQTTTDTDLRQFLNVGPEETTPDPHPLMVFFAMRDVKQAKLAKWCNTNAAYMSQMLRGYRFTPDKINSKLYELRDKILDREKRTGKLFNIGGPAPDLYPTMKGE